MSGEPLSGVCLRFIPIGSLKIAPTLNRFGDVKDTTRRLGKLVLLFCSRRARSATCARNWNAGWVGDMGLGLVLMVASGLLGFAAGVWITAFVLELVSLAVAFSVAFLLQFNGFGFKDGAIILVGALLVSQIAYLGGVFVRSRSRIRSLLFGDVLDDGPDSGGERDIANDNEKHD